MRPPCRSLPARRRLICGLARLPLAACTLLALTTCGGVADSGGAPAGAWTVSDSAGIPFVHNPATVEERDAVRLTLREDLRIGVVDGPTEYQFGYILHVDVSSTGLIHVLDIQANVVRVYDDRGRYVRTIGRPGEGPGELQSPGALLVGPGDSVFVLDRRPRRITVFAPDGAAVRTLPLPEFGAGWKAVPGDAFANLDRPSLGAPNQLLRRWDAATLRADTLLEMEVGPTSQAQVAMPFARWEPLTDGRIVFAWSTDYRLEVYGRDGALERVITRDHPQETYTDAEKRQLFDRAAERSPSVGYMGEIAARRLANAQIGDRPPVVGAIHAGPRGSIWVGSLETLAEARNAGRVNVLATGLLDVFGPEGRLLGHLSLPEGFWHVRTHGDHLYGFVRDELGVQYLVRLRVEGLP